MKNKFRLLLVHGWGFSASFWQDMREYLPDIPTYTINLGFVGNETEKNIDLQKILSDQEQIVAIGHSLGFMYLLKKFPLKFRYYIGINAFACFSKRDNFVSGISTRILERMAKGLIQDKRLLLQNFYQQCGYKGFVPFQVNIEKLQEGLDCLKHDDCRSLMSAIQDKLTVIASTHDPVVSLEMTKESFLEKNIRWVEDTHHVLPIDYPLYCARLIEEVLLNG